MPCDLKKIPKEIVVPLDFPYLGKDYPKHYFPVLNHENMRQAYSDLYDENNKLREGEPIFNWWKVWVKDKTRKEYVGLGEDWKHELWNDPEGRKHIVAAVQDFVNKQVPQSFLPA